MRKPVRKRNRLSFYDYSRDGLYYFTSNVKNNVCFFGEVRRKSMVLNSYGLIVWQQWYWLEDQYPYVILHDFVVMPNHIHGVIEINRNNIMQKLTNNSDIEETDLKIKPVYDLIGAFKMTASKSIRMLQEKNDPEFIENRKFAWHRSFHDHIIRGQNAYLRISKYIENNPKNWKNDEYYK